MMTNLLPATGESSRSLRLIETSDAPRIAAGIVTVTSVTEPSAAALRRLPAEVTALEIRADLVGDLDVSRLRRHFPGMLIYALRSVRSGGRGDDHAAARRARLLAAAGRYDIVELEAETDLVPDLLTRIPADQRCVSWRGGPADVAALRARFTRISRVPAWLYLLAPVGSSSAAALAPLSLLRTLGRRDVTAFLGGSAGTWTRVLAPWFGASVVFGRMPDALRANGTDPGTPTDAPTVHQLVGDYGFPALPPLRDLYGIAARATNTTLFLSMFNAAFRRLGLPGLFVPLSVPDAASFGTSF